MRKWSFKKSTLSPKKCAKIIDNWLDILKHLSYLKPSVHEEAIDFIEFGEKDANITGIWF